jgi:hypothetical protein
MNPIPICDDYKPLIGMFLYITSSAPNREMFTCASKRGPLVQLAVYIDGAPHCIHQLLTDNKTKPGAAIPAYMGAAFMLGPIARIHVTFSSPAKSRVVNSTANADQRASLMSTSQARMLST